MRQNSPNLTTESTRPNPLAANKKVVFGDLMKRYKQIKPQYLAVAAILLVLLTATMVAAPKVRQAIKVAQLTPAILTINPESSNVTPGGNHIIELKVNTQSAPVDGVQIVAYLDGDIPSDISIEGAAVDGLTPLIASVTQDGAKHKLTLVMLTSNPQTPYINETPTTIGTLSFTAPDQGRLEITLDKKLTKITAHGEAENVIDTPRSVTYQFK